MLKLDKLSFHYPGAKHPALSAIDLDLQAGQCLGLLGSNGAGKTTLLSLLSGVLQPQSGQILWQGTQPLGLVPQQLALYAELRVRENLQLFADLYQLRGSQRKQRLTYCIATTALAEKLDCRAGHLSGGEQRRLNFAIGLLQPAALYLFDEATVGVDAASRQLLLDAILQLRAEGKTVIYTSHYLEEIERVADRILLLHEGRVHLDIDKQQLLGDQLGLFLEWPAHSPAGLLALLDNLALEYQHLPNAVHIPALDLSQLQVITGWLNDRQHSPSLLRFGRPSLEQLYLRLNGGKL